MRPIVVARLHRVGMRDIQSFEFAEKFCSAVSAHITLQMHTPVPCDFPMPLSGQRRDDPPTAATHRPLSPVTTHPHQALKDEMLERLTLCLHQLNPFHMRRPALQPHLDTTKRRDLRVKKGRRIPGDAGCVAQPCQAAGLVYQLVQERCVLGQILRHCSTGSQERAAKGEGVR